MDSVNRPSLNGYRDVEIEFTSGSVARYRVYASMFERLKDIFFGAPSLDPTVGYVVCYGIHEDYDFDKMKNIVTVND